MGLFGILWKVVAVAILAIIGLGAYFYISDSAVTATIVERSDDPNDPFVVIRPNAPLLSTFEYKAALDRTSWQFVCEGYNVDYHVKSQQYVVYDQSGQVVYRSDTGELDEMASIRCTTSNGLI